MSFQEGKRVKKFEGIPVKEEEVLADVERDVMGGEMKHRGEDKAVVEEEKGSPSTSGAQ